MAKARPTRARHPTLQLPPPVRILKPFQPFDQTNAIKDLLAAAARPSGEVVVRSGEARRNSSAVVVHRGVARGSSSRLRSFEDDVSHWFGWSWNVPAPPAGQVLWFTLGLWTQWWEWLGPSGRNNTSHFLYADFGVTWRWMLLAELNGGAQLAQLMFDQNRYELYASLAPGDNLWRASWIHPARSVTLTPYDKESDPNPLALLLSTESGGELVVQFAGDFPSSGVTFNGKETHLYVIKGGPDTLYYSYAVLVPKPQIKFPNLKVAMLRPAGPPKPLRRARTRRSAR
jgi:hypothetical protein